MILAMKSPGIEGANKLYTFDFTVTLAQSNAAKLLSQAR